MTVCNIKIENATDDSKVKLEELYSTTSIPRLIQNNALHDCQEPNSNLSSIKSKNDAPSQEKAGVEGESNNGKALEDSTDLQGGFRIQNVGEVENVASTSDNILGTPTLSMRSMEFSPLLTFSEDRDIASNELKIPNQSMSSNVTKSEARMDCESYQAVGFLPTQGQQIYENDNGQRVHYNPCQDASPQLVSNHMTYADSLIHNSTNRVLPIRPPIIPVSTRKPLEKKNVGNKKRKTATSSRIRHRQPQKRFSIDMKSSRVEGGSLFGAKNNGQVRLTTNKAREVEALDPITKRRMHLYASCSEAARIIKVNRTRVSRSKLDIEILRIFHRKF